MADAPFGLSFAPGENKPAGNDTGRLQQAIQTLSLRLPRVPGASSFTATPLLNSQGGGALGSPNDAMVLEQLKRLLFGGMQGGAPGGMGGGSAPPSGLASLFGGAGLPSGGFTPRVQPGSGGDLPRDPDPAQSPAPPMPPQTPSADPFSIQPLPGPSPSMGPGIEPFPDSNPWDRQQ